MRCQRCDRESQKLVVVENTANRTQTSKLCSACVQIVIRENTVWQIKRV